MKKNDFILIFILLSMAAVSFILYNTQKAAKGAKVIVTIDGTEYASLPLDKNTTLEIKSPEGINILIIENNCAYIKEASCPDLICVKHKKISNNNESIICIPNKVIVTITGGSFSETDSVVQ